MARRQLEYTPMSPNSLVRREIQGHIYARHLGYLLAGVSLRVRLGYSMAGASLHALLMGTNLPTASASFRACRLSTALRTAGRLLPDVIHKIDAINYTGYGPTPRSNGFGF
jgi:hypothetical protein